MKKISVNYIFFSILFLLIFCSSFFNIISIVHSSKDYTIFFTINSLGQAFLEVCGLILLTYFIKKYLPKFLYLFFLGFLFLFAVVHIIDFILIFLMDLSFYEGLSIVLDETLSNFIELLLLTNISGFTWIILGICTLILPFIGIFIYKSTNKLSSKKPLLVKIEHLFSFIFILAFALFFWDLYSSPNLNADVHNSYQKSLPWKTTFLFERNKTIKLSKKMNDFNCKSEKKYYDIAISQIDKKPNIYIFVVESLRKDYINETISPNIYNFQKENISIKMPLASSNYTPSSWFSIFYSKYPFRWTSYITKKHKNGSYNLHVLKKLGYKIKVLSSSGLHFYFMNRVIFGKNNKLMTHFENNHNPSKIQPYLADKKAIEYLKKEKEKEGNVYVIFLESTHFNYSWPPEKKIKFYPIIDNVSSFINYTTKKNLEEIKNRYKNSINYVDSLFSEFLNDLKEKNIYKDSIIVFTGDHGEEFFEKGKLFHASHLSKAQMDIPIIYKLGDKYKNKMISISSHIDIFPTIFKHILKKDDFEKFTPLWHGSSIFHNDNYAITTRFNASRPPKEFCLHTKENKVILKFNSRNIFNTNDLQILSIKDNNDDNPSYDLHKENLLIENLSKILNKSFSK